ncbi:unnamed protein product [Microthlaspi erraticum]|uniref:Retrovirus-related Pol polyprotein from transposon TNT 1-94-like beta-barrel domain-containing protein n=1 Tax=Microthlaspi erraticum TaxID=1685480 RepID=A0A6D2JBX3_9BRAS|nr:unnamed protein product [Microthlaspi erraticum]
MAGDSDLTVTNPKPREGGNTASIQCPMLTATNYTVWAIRMESIPEALVLQVGGLKTAKKVWEAIKSRNMGAERVKEARLQTLMSEFERLRMKESETIDDFGGKLAEIASKAAALGETIEEPKLAFEERVRDEDENQEDQSKLMYANTERKTNQSTHDNLEWKYQGKRSWRTLLRGRGRGRSSYEERDTSNVECFRAQEEENGETKKADDLMMHEVVYLNEKNCIPSNFETNTGEENIWYLDNGASNHMTGDQRYFSEIDNSVTGKVRFGDDSRIDIKGKGSISFVDMNGESRKMSDVYFIPD